MYSQNTYINRKDCRIGDYYPEYAASPVREAIRAELARQWACIAAGEEWDPGRPPEPILSLLNGHLAWCRIPGAEPGPNGSVIIPERSPFSVNGEAAWISAWERPDGIYVTLSSTGAERLGVEPVGLTRRRRRLAAGEEVVEIEPGRFALRGLTDAVGDALSGDRAYMARGETMPIVYTRENDQREDGPAIPLFRWASQEGRHRWWRAHQPFASLDAIGVASIPDDCCQAEKERVFTRPDREAEEIDRAIMATA